MSATAQRRSSNPKRFGNINHLLRDRGGPLSCGLTFWP